MTDGWHRARWPILGFVLFGSAAILVLLADYAGAIAAESVESLVIALAGALSTFWVSRSLRLALLVGAMPILAAILSFGILAPLAAEFPLLCDVLVPHAIAAALVPVTAAAAVAASMLVTDLCAGMEPDPAAWRAIARVRLPALLSLLIVVLARALFVLPAVFAAPHSTQASDYSVVGTLVTGAIAALLLLLIFPVAAGLVRLNEGAIATANRRRERRERNLVLLELSGEPRWALSFCGIALVFAALVFLGPTQAHQFWQGYAAPATLLVTGLVGALGLRDWRMLLAIPLGAALAGTLAVAWPGGWSQLETGNLVLTWNSYSALPTTVALVCGPSLLMAARISGHRRFEDPITIAIALALKELATPVFAFSVTMSIASIPARLWVGPLAAAFLALVLTPAMLAVVEVLFPRTRSVEDLYRNR